MESRELTLTLTRGHVGSAAAFPAFLHMKTLVCSQLRGKGKRWRRSCWILKRSHLIQQSLNRAVYKPIGPAAERFKSLCSCLEAPLHYGCWLLVRGQVSIGRCTALYWPAEAGSVFICGGQEWVIRSPRASGTFSFSTAVQFVYILMMFTSNYFLRASYIHSCVNYNFPINTSDWDWVRAEALTATETYMRRGSLDISITRARRFDAMAAILGQIAEV